MDYNAGMRIRITSIATSFGPHLDTAQLEQDLGLEPGFIRRKTGIENLHEFSSPEDFVEACTSVSRKAIAQAGLAVNQIAGIYAPATLTEYFCPTLSTRVAKELGLAADTSSVTVGLGCVGGLASLQAAYNQLAVDSMEGRTSYYVVLAADYVTGMTRKDDYKTRVLFSDAMAGMVVTNNEAALGGFEITRIYTRSLSDGPIEALNVSRADDLKWRMDGRAVSDFALGIFPRILRDLGTSADTLDLIIPHQANKRLLEKVCEREHIPLEKVYMDSAMEHGNTSASSVFIGLSDCWDKTAMRQIALLSFGADLQYGGAIMQRTQ